jgi:hypothetical protein
MIAAIADTHTIIWYLFSDARLGKAASAFIDNTIASFFLTNINAGFEKHQCA